MNLLTLISTVVFFGVSSYLDLSGGGSGFVVVRGISAGVLAILALLGVLTFKI